MGQNKKFI